MNYLKHFQNTEYVKGKNDCWTFVQDVFEEEQGYRLPDCPIYGTDKEYKGHLKANIKFTLKKEPKKGLLVHVTKAKLEHIGYAVNGKQYIHKTFDGVICSDIPKTAFLYEVLM